MGNTLIEWEESTDLFIIFLQVYNWMDSHNLSMNSTFVAIADVAVVKHHQ